MNVDEKQLRKRLSRPDTEIFLRRTVDYRDLADVINEYLQQHNQDLVEKSVLDFVEVLNNDMKLPQDNWIKKLAKEYLQIIK